MRVVYYLGTKIIKHPIKSDERMVDVGGCGSRAPPEISYEKISHRGRVMPGRKN
jgi:hypothetical protein